MTKSNDPSDSMPHNILVVEDYADLRAALVSALSRAHYTCDEAGSSEDAVKKLREQHYNAVLLSTRLPIADDPVMRFVLAEDADKRPRVILMTEPDQTTDDYPSLMKPFNYEQLFAKLTK